MTRIIRVFPVRTSYTPTDDLSYIGAPPLLLPTPSEDYEVHVSTTFTWNRAEAERLQGAWAAHYPIVRIGGPAYNSNGIFVPGRYIKQGVTFTSRGCNNRCAFCLVPEREGRLHEIDDFSPGYIIQDNNLLQCSRAHIERVLVMLQRQKRGAIFSGGLEAALVTDWFADALRGMRVHEVYLACDTEGAIKSLRKAVEKLAFLGRQKLRCYVLIGRGTIETDTARLMAVWEAGCLPFAQTFQPPTDKRIEYPPEWKRLQRTWSRPAATKALMGGTK